MDKKKKIVAAITAAINMYLEEEAMAVCAANRPQISTPAVQMSLPIISPWSFAGRCSIMERRFNWQYRCFKF